MNLVACPDCRAQYDVTEMTLGSAVGGLLVQECTKCLGLWAPDDAFDGLFERASAAARNQATKGEAAAPRVDA